MSPSKWLRCRVTPLPRWFSRRGAAAPPLRGPRVRGAGAVPSLGRARAGRAHRGSSRGKTEPAQPLVVPLAPQGPVCRHDTRSGLQDKGRAAVRAAMGCRQPIGPCAGGERSAHNRYYRYSSPREGALARASSRHGRGSWAGLTLQVSQIEGRHVPRPGMRATTSTLAWAGPWPCGAGRWRWSIVVQGMGLSF